MPMTSHRPLLNSSASTGEAESSVVSSPSTDQSLDDLPLRAPAKRPRRVLTAEEKSERRRLQYKLHQRRHRAKQQERTAQLEVEVCQLAEAVATLNDERRMIMQSQRVFHSRTSLVGAPVKVTSEYLRQFSHGYAGSERGHEQEQFLRFIMVPDVAGPDYRGIDQLMEQTRLYDQFFAKTLCKPGAVDVAAIGEMTVVTISVVLSVYPRRDGVLCLYPNLCGNEEVIQILVSKALDVPGKLRFVFDHTGACTWFGTDLDFVAGLQQSLGSLDKVYACLQDANISLTTGQIAPATALLDKS